jgi:hypothetical protein
LVHPKSLLCWWQVVFSEAKQSPPFVKTHSQRPYFFLKITLVYLSGVLSTDARAALWFHTLMQETALWCAVVRSVDAEAVLWCAVVLSDDLTCALGCDVVVSRPVQSFFSVLILLCSQEHHVLVV